jgi:hypothetical protein
VKTRPAVEAVSEGNQDGLKKGQEMATAQANPLLRYVHQLAVGGTAGDVPDAALLDRFVRHRDEAAFAALLRRHGPMVFAVCRRVLRDEHAAEDALQATFLVLARKADSLRQGKLCQRVYGRRGKRKHGGKDEAAGGSTFARIRFIVSPLLPKR